MDVDGGADFGHGGTASLSVTQAVSELDVTYDLAIGDTGDTSTAHLNKVGSVTVTNTGDVTADYSVGALVSRFLGAGRRDHRARLAATLRRMRDDAEHGVHGMVQHSRVARERSLPGLVRPDGGVTGGGDLATGVSSSASTHPAPQRKHVDR